jgi:D-alanyl-D-alanine carboxypeptidase/D-alanyl-D-alanine-endopeptidase (penicillin-binding protein 4)
MRFLALAFALLALAARSQTLPETVAEILTRAGIPAESVAAVVEPAGGGAAIVSVNATRPMNPASVMKLVTTFAALDMLGPAYTFKTEALVTGQVSGGVLSGDLVLRGGGDPKLTYDRLWLLLAQLRSRGVREIRGNLVLDRSFFAPVAHDAALFDNEPRRAYNVGPDALLLNFKAATLRLVPEKGAVRASLDPDLPSIELHTRLKLVEGPCGDWRDRLKLEVDEQDLLATMQVSGNFAASCGERVWPVSLYDADRYASVIFRSLWSQLGGRFDGKVVSGRAPDNAELLVAFESEPLSNLVRDINKFSNNVMARQVFLTLSAAPPAQPGEAAASERAIKGWLKGRGLDFPELVLENGSGLSRKERLSVKNTVALLQEAWKSAVMPELMSSLPITAVDGTFKRRFGNGAAAGQSHLKGGTLTGVRAVAGWVLDRKGRRWVVAMTINDARAGSAQGALDALVEWVAARD